MFKYVKIAIMLGILVETSRNLKDELLELTSK